VRYTDTWLDTFLPVPPEQTRRELDFLHRHLPLPGFRRIIDVCCGSGRHANGLSDMGYTVLGIDTNLNALARAQVRRSRDAYFAAADMREPPAIGPVDAVLIMWQSFGAYDDRTNGSVLALQHELLRPGGRFVLDIYNRGFFEDHQGSRRSDRDGRTVFEEKWLEGDRLHIRLRYGESDDTDTFEWRVYDPDEILVEARATGFDIVCCCAGFDEAQPASRSVPRMQLVFERH